MQLSLPESAQATSSVCVVPIPEKEENIVITKSVSEYTLTAQNFKKIVKQGKRFEAKLRLFADKIKLIINKKVKVIVAPFLNLYGHIDKMEHRVNKRLKEILVPDFTVFEAALVKKR